jgi:hypothetical protein
VCDVNLEKWTQLIKVDWLRFRKVNWGRALTLQAPRPRVMGCLHRGMGIMTPLGSLGILLNCFPGVGRLDF